MEVNLKEAALLCRKSEKTLRRKIEAGLLQGRKEPLEFGGFMWLIDVESLDELYPGSRPCQLPQLYNSPDPPEVRLKNRRPEQSNPTGLAFLGSLDERSEQEPNFTGQAVSEQDDDDDDEEWDVRQSFFDYILDENRTLKSELKNRDARILSLNERACILERALGEQEGTSATQSRVLEWFQSQESQREKTRSEMEHRLLQGDSQETTKQQRKPILAALGGALVTALLAVLCGSLGLL